MKVFVNFDASYDRIPHPDASLEESINEVRAFRKKNKTIVLLLLRFCFRCQNYKFIIVNNAIFSEQSEDNLEVFATELLFLSFSFLINRRDANLLILVSLKRFSLIDNLSR